MYPSIHLSVLPSIRPSIHASIQVISPSSDGFGIFLNLGALGKKEGCFQDLYVDLTTLPSPTILSITNYNFKQKPDFPNKH